MMGIKVNKCMNYELQRTGSSIPADLILLH